ncbi:MAG: hypothetical protein AAF555_11100 [Verrucomicrobiota bacterium]
MFGAYENFVWSLLLGLPLGLTLIIAHRESRRQKATRDLSFLDRFRPPPGRKLQEELENFRLRQDETGLWLFLLTALGVAFQLMPYSFESSTWEIGFRAFMAVGVVAPAVLFARRSTLLRRQIRHHQLRLATCEAVSRELPHLVGPEAQLYHGLTFHDRPGSQFTFDQIIVTLTGVFAVNVLPPLPPESLQPLLFRRKATRQALVDGEALTITFPWGETHGELLSQTRRHSQFLSSWLSSAAQGTVPVIPVLFIPGYDLRLKGKGPVKVVTETTLADLLCQEQKALPPAHYSSIVSALAKRQQGE